jgi:hemolysin activation/secretion protein
MYAANDTWFGMGFGAFFFDQDNWRVITAAGKGSVNFQFYLDNPIDMWIPYNTSFDFVYGQVQRRVIGTFYAGISYTYLKLNTISETLPVSTNATLNGAGITLSLDERSNFYYPREGYQTNLWFNSYPEFLGNATQSNKLEIEHNHYLPFRDQQDVLALRAKAGIGLGDLTFEQQFVVGRQDIRGYTQGAVRGNHLLAIQGEYRWNFASRLGLVGFAGLATVFEAINESDNGRILPGIGCGFRWTAFTDNHMNVGMDIATGDGDWGVYFRVGEVF